jgi:hypothetical protein
VRIHLVAFYGPPSGIITAVEMTGGKNKIVSFGRFTGLEAGAMGRVTPLQIYTA